MSMIENGICINYCFENYAALIADSEEKLCQLVEEFGSVCTKRKLKMNDSKS